MLRPSAQPARLSLVVLTTSPLGPAAPCTWRERVMASELTQLVSGRAWPLSLLLSPAHSLLYHAALCYTLRH